MYRKAMEIEGDIVRHSRKYRVDPSLARAVCMYESGGNANLTSGAGASGYFQSMLGRGIAANGVRCWTGFLGTDD
jgi:soluble lytic murein transglycosylase-like protein